jgi:hypothetical protein
MSSAPEPALRVAHELGVVDVIEIVEDDFHQLPARLAGAAIAVLPRVHCAGIPQKLMNYMAVARTTEPRPSGTFSRVPGGCRWPF